MINRKHQLFYFRACAGGLTLVELLVSIVLGLLLSGGMVTAYLGAKRNFYYEEQMARMQENGRYAMRLLSRELAMAGFYGGMPLGVKITPAALSADCSDGDWALDSTDPLDLVNDYAGQALPVSVNLTPLTCIDHLQLKLDTDLVTVKRTAADASSKRGIAAAALTSSTIEGWYMRVVSGSRPEWVMLRPIDLYDSVHTLPSLSYWEAIARVFFVRAYANVKGDDVPTLCMETLAGDEMTSRCLVEGVENLQLEFGIDADGDGVPNQYLSVPTATQMQRAVAVRIHLLLRSIGKMSGYVDDKEYRLGRKILPAKRDAYLRRVLSSTVLLRNHVAVRG